MLSTEPKALLIDITRCIGCKECIGGCLAAHDLPGSQDDVAGLSATALTALAEKGDLYVRQLCRHCLEPACASVCPVEAFVKLPTGPVVYDGSRCMGCRYCIQACAFNVPKYEWDKPVPLVVKCDFCARRQAAGKVTACTEACPAEATVFGSRAELLAEARRRIAAAPDAYYPEVYGEDEVGGTSVLFLSPVPFAQLGFRTDLGDVPLPYLTSAALAKIPGIVSIGGSFLFGLWWLTHRRDEVARFEARERERTAAQAANEVTHENR